MIAIGIKNAILFLLIILILHFLIKNILLDRQTETQKPSTKEPAYFENFEENKLEEKKMMDYIMEPCKPKQPEEIEISNTCKMEVVETKKEDDMKVKADCHLQQDKRNFMIIKEYDTKVLDGLDAFDSYDTYFQTYSSQCNAK